MNQILSLELDKNKGKKGQSDIKKVVSFFAIVLMIFGLILVGKSVYSMIKGEPEEKIISSEVIKPELNVEQEGNKLRLEIDSTIDLAKAEYKWNNDSEKKIDLSTETSYSGTIDIPVGNNKFYIKVTDSQGHYTEFSDEYSTSADRPQISITSSGGKIKITVKDNKSLEYVTYKWDEDGEEQKVEADEETRAQIEFEIDIVKGRHTLYVTAVNSDGVEETKEQQTAIGTEPKITLEQDPEDRKKLIIYAEDADGIAELFFTLNGDEFATDDLTDMGLKELTYEHELSEGSNHIKAKVTNINGITAEKEATCQYDGE